MKTLERVPGWKRISAAPERVDELEKRVAALEEKLGNEWPADVCRFCGERALRLTNTAGPNDKGNMVENWRCGACQKRERRTTKPR